MVKTCVVRGAWYVGLLLLVPAGLRAQDIIGIPVGETPPAVTLESLTGDSIPLSQWIGKKPVIVEFWATWCPICAELLPRMEAAQQKFGDRAAFLVVAVAVNQSKNSVRRHLEREPMPFTFLWDDVLHRGDGCEGAGGLHWGRRGPRHRRGNRKGGRWR